MNKTIIGTVTHFNPSEQRILLSLVDHIVPRDEDRQLPAASETEVLTYLIKNEQPYVPLLKEELVQLGARTADMYGSNFDELSLARQAGVIEELRANNPRFLQGLAMCTVSCYYQDDRVMRAIGLEPRAPFPLGYQVKSGDLSLLDPVRQRGRMYRDV